MMNKLGESTKRPCRAFKKENARLRYSLKKDKQNLTAKRYT